MESIYKTIVVSDVHLGTKDSKARELVRFLKANPASNIILNGDIIDGWRLRKKGKWKKKHTLFFKTIMKFLENRDTRVFYIRGNHDDFLDEILPFSIGNFHIVRDHIYESFGKKYYVCHGDIFDSISTNHIWLAKLGDWGYTFLLWLNKIYNKRRRRKGLEYYSISKAAKAKVKSAVSFIDDFENKLAEVAALKKCDGVICGHIHSPANRYINHIHYLNSGDWIESLTALTEDFAGNWKVHHYHEFQKQGEVVNLKISGAFERMEKKEFALSY